MARKTRKQKQRAVTRRPGPSTAPPTESAPSGVAVEAEDLQPVSTTDLAPVTTTAPAPTSTRRRVERVGVAAPSAAPPSRGRNFRTPSTGYIQPLETEDAAIPFDRVPYVPADLRRVAVMATLMVILIIVADIVVSNVVK